MNPAPIEEITDSIVRMRSSLARVELAASRLARDSLTPATRDLAIGISDSVREIDDEIGETLRAFRTEPAVAIDPGDCAEILTILRDRMSPVLTAHGIDWADAEETGEIFIEDRAAIERAALVMLRAGIILGGRGGTLRLSLVRDSEAPCIGIRLATERLSPAVHDASPPHTDALASARAFAHRHRASISVEGSQAGAEVVTLWLPASEFK